MCYEGKIALKQKVKKKNPKHYIGKVLYKSNFKILTLMLLILNFIRTSIN